MIQGMQNNEEEMAKKELSKKVEWIKLQKEFEPLFVEKRFDVETCDKAVQHTTVSAAEKVEALSALLGRQDTSNSAQKQKEQLNLQQ